ncbi:hypothetical protein HpMS107_60410 [Helicobacter pylori]
MMTDLFATITADDEKSQAVDAQGLCFAASGTRAGATSAFPPSNEAAKADIVICNANILAIDIGTTTGWALGLRDGKLHSGSQSFAPRRNEGPGQRWLKFAAWLGERARQAGEIHVVYYEKVRRHAGTTAAHVYGGFEAHLEAWADRNRIRLVGVQVQAIKKAATGDHRASKDAMIAAMRARGHRVIDDNHADALALLEHARKEEA